MCSNSHSDVYSPSTQADGRELPEARNLGIDPLPATVIAVAVITVVLWNPTPTEGDDGDSDVD